MSKHTPGQWSYEDRMDASCGSPCTPNGCHESHPSGVYVVNGPAVGDWPDDECVTTSKADAALMAKAPDTHKALRAFVAAMEQQTDPGRSRANVNGISRRLDKAYEQAKTVLGDDE